MFLLNECPQFLEPIGSAAPKFASKINSLSFEEVATASLALICPAQGSPIPSFR
jgi:hypothetical protein